MLTVATLLWDPNENSAEFSRCYNETWVEKLHAGFRRHLARPFRFVVFTDRDRDFSGGISQRRLTSATPGYGDCIEPYRLDSPMILVGLDTIVTGDVGHLADYCLTADRIALPLDPFKPSRVCNGVALVPAGQAGLWQNWRGENDMEYLRAQPHAIIDTLWPGHVASYKCHVRRDGLADARLVYFHGHEKPHELRADWIAQHWKV